LVEPLVDRVLLLRQPLLERLELAAPLARGLLEFAARLEELLLGQQLGLAQLGLAVALGGVDQFLGALASLAEDLAGSPAREQPPAHARDPRRGQRHGGHDVGVGHPPPRRKRSGGRAGTQKTASPATAVWARRV